MKVIKDYEHARNSIYETTDTYYKKGSNQLAEILALLNKHEIPYNPELISDLSDIATTQWKQGYTTKC
jgi:penicillin V acylase-like amidase (Ntn superfamily)